MTTATHPGLQGEPWTKEYNEAHRGFVARELDDAAARSLPQRRARCPTGSAAASTSASSSFRGSRPRGSPAGARRRVDAQPPARAGALRPRVDELHIVTLAPEPHSYPQLGVSYLYADLRELPLADATYDRVVSISTLEHVGMDTSYYGGETEAAEDPQRDCSPPRSSCAACSPGGDLLTVPVGLAERFEWARALTPAELDDSSRLRARPVEVAYFRYAAARGGARTATAWPTRATATIHERRGGEDGVVAAEAIACLHLVKPGQAGGGNARVT